MTSKVLAVIPARFPSTRLHGKPLKDIEGKTLIQRVWEQASQAKKISHLVIATDDDSIFEAARRFGAEVLMTGDDLATGSDRVSEAYSILHQAGESFDLVANVQGDMPFINPEVIDGAIEILESADQSFGMSTVCRPITDLDEFVRTSAVKVVFGEDNQAFYFSRAPIPYQRDGFDEADVSEANPFGHKHIGLYVFRPDALTRLATLKVGPLESKEKLEQLRALSNSIKIKVAVFSQQVIEPSIEVDEQSDLDRAILHAKSL